MGLYPSHQRGDDQDHEQESEGAAREVAPLAAVGPRGEDADQKQDHENEKKKTDAHRGSSGMEPGVGSGAASGALDGGMVSGVADGGGELTSTWMSFVTR